tara:strand:+ start:71 stop:739 length:669 start_codon:yes stop_codon:yes gene_type:complete
MYCSQCGKEIDVNSNFCSECGNKIFTKEQSIPNDENKVHSNKHFNSVVQYLKNTFNVRKQNNWKQATFFGLFFLLLFNLLPFGYISILICPLVSFYILIEKGLMREQNLIFIGLSSIIIPLITLYLSLNVPGWAFIPVAYLTTKKNLNQDKINSDSDKDLVYLLGKVFKKSDLIFWIIILLIGIIGAAVAAYVSISREFEIKDCIITENRSRYWCEEFINQR